MSGPTPASTVEMAIIPGNNRAAYAGIISFVALSYILIVGHYVDFVNHVLPHGDPFSYTVNWFLIIDEYHASGYLQTLATYLSSGSWYRLMDLSVAALAPVLTKEPYVICVVNYVLFGFATAAFYRLGRRLGLTAQASFAVALIPWLWPANYGFEDQSPIPVLALDSAFNAMLFWAVAQAYGFAFDIQRMAEASGKRYLRSTVSAILTGIIIGIAVWGRGNSLPVVGLVVSWPCLLMLWFAWRSRDARIWINVIIAGVVASLIAIQFYVQYWKILHDYYGIHASLITVHWTPKEAWPFILNIPGFMYWRSENSIVCVAMTFASHLLVLLALAAVWWPRGPFRSLANFESRQLIIGGVVIYLGTYLVDMMLFANQESGFSIYQALMVWRPMLIGLSLILFAIAVELFSRFGSKLDHLIPVPLAALALAWGVLWTHIYTPWELENQLPSPRAVERFAVNLDQLADNGKIAVLWYRGWSERVLNYYRIKDDLPIANQFPFSDIEYIWSMSDYSNQNRVRVLDEMKNVFEKASLIVIPEFLDEYASNEYYAFYKFKNDWAAWLNSNEAPRFRVLMLLRESPSMRLLVIQRDELANGKGDPFRLPYGNRPNLPQPHYSNAVIRFDDASSGAKIGAPPELLYEYKGYNIVRARGLYVAVAQDAGPMDVMDVLNNTAPRPPDDKFIVGDDDSNLKVKIDAYAKDAEANSPPELLYEYKGYNIVRARGLYVAVAQDAGPMDVGDVLTNIAPRPPADKFMIAHDAASLETAIDALTTAAEPASSGQ